VLPTGINISALKAYDTIQEVKEHIFENGLINENQGRVVDASTLHVVLDVLCVKALRWGFSAIDANIAHSGRVTLQV
jgi:hypothetical protein